MNITVIKDAIIRLENEETTLDNVRELADLYTVRDHFRVNTVERELSDILPAYRAYCEFKRQYELSGENEDKVIEYMSYVCKEICEFIETLYSNTDFYRERKEIIKILEKLSKKYLT